MAINQLPDLEYLRQCFCYDASSGKLTWLERPISHFGDELSRRKFNYRYSGKAALNTMHRTGALVGTLNRKQILAHRVAFYLGTGIHPDMDIDHINGNPADNRLCNLRLATKLENAKNRKRTPGIRKFSSYGVRQNSKNSWQAYIGVGYKTISLGSFPTEEMAIEARRNAEREYNFSPTHGRIPPAPDRPFE